MDDIIFKTQEDAEKVLDAMRTLVTTYGSVTVAQFYQLSGIDYEKITYQEDRLCWYKRDIDKVTVSHAHGGGFKLVLPLPEPLD